MMLYRVLFTVMSLILFGVAAAPASAQTIDAGLNAPFEYPAPVTGRTLNVVNYGATSNNSSNNDATAMQNAINAAVAGDEVYVPDGVWDVKSRINLKDGVSFRCQSHNAVIQSRYPSGWFTSPPNSALYAAPGVDNLTVSDCRLTVASGSSYQAGVRFGDSSTAATATTKSFKVVVRNMLIEKHQRFGVQLENTRFALVENNTIRNASALNGGGSGYGVLIASAGSNNNWVRNNTIGPVIRHAILAQWRANHNLIEYNQISGTVSGAIDMHGEDEYSNEIAHNTVRDCVRNGTSVSPNGGGIEIGEFSGRAGTTSAHDNSGPNNYVHHNEVFNCTYGLRVMNESDSIVVEDNNFHHNLNAGIAAELWRLDDLTVQRNTIAFNGKGVVLNDVNRARVLDNMITDNTGVGLWTDDGTQGYTITGNTIVRNNPDVQLGSANGTYVP